MNTFLLLCVSLLLQSIRATRQWANETHQIYTFDTVVDALNTNDSDNDIDCSATANCLVECLTQASCNDRSIHAFSNVDNVQVLCGARDSCTNLVVNTNNQSTVSLQCVDSDACRDAVIHMLYSRNAHLSVVCREEGSCASLQIAVAGVYDNTIAISCDTATACEDVHIYMLQQQQQPTDWLTLLSFADETELTLFCSDNTNASLVSMAGDIRCMGHRECCPQRYQSVFDVSAFYTTSNNDAWITTTTDVVLIELDNWFLFTPLQNYVVSIFWLTVLYAAVVFVWACLYNCCHTFRACAQYKSLQDMELLRRRLRTHSNNDDVPSSLAEAAVNSGNNSSACATICKGSSKCNILGYVMDAFVLATDLVLVVSIYVYRDDDDHDDDGYAYNRDLWTLAAYVSIAATSFGLSLYMLKFMIMARFYAHINTWRMKIAVRYPAPDVNRIASPRAKSPKTKSPRSLKSPKRSATSSHSHSDDQKLLFSDRHRHAVSVWHYIQSKRVKIHQYLTHLAMFDLLSASMQLAPNVMVVCFLFTELARTRSDEDGDDDALTYNTLLLSQSWQHWTLFEWLLRCKLVLGVTCMLYAVFNAMSVECKLCDCKADKLRDKKAIQPQTNGGVFSYSEPAYCNDFLGSHDSLSTDGRASSGPRLMNPVYAKIDTDDVEFGADRKRSSVGRRRSRASFLEHSIYQPTVLAAANLMSIGQRRESKTAKDWSSNKAQSAAMSHTQMVVQQEQLSEEKHEVENKSSVAANNGDDTVIGILIGGDDDDDDDADDECQELNANVDDDVSRRNGVRKANARQDSMLSMNTVHEADMLETMVLTPSQNQLSDVTDECGPNSRAVHLMHPVLVPGLGTAVEHVESSQEKRFRVVVNEWKDLQQSKAATDLSETEDMNELEGSEPSQKSNTPQTEVMHFERATPQTIAYSADESLDNTLVLADV